MKNIPDTLAFSHFLEEWENNHLSLIELYNRSHNGAPVHKAIFRSMINFFRNFYRSENKELIIDKYLFTIPDDKAGAIDKIIEFKELVKYLHKSFTYNVSHVNGTYKKGNKFFRRPAVKYVIHQDKVTKDIVMTYYLCYHPGALTDQYFDDIFNNYYSSTGYLIQYSSENIHDNIVNELKSNTISEMIEILLMTKNIYPLRPEYKRKTRKNARYTGQSRMRKYH